MKQMKNIKMAIVFAVALTVSLVWGINEEAKAEPTCDFPRCHRDTDTCEPGYAISFRKSCKDDFGNMKCLLLLDCSTIFPEPE